MGLVGMKMTGNDFIYVSRCVQRVSCPDLRNCGPIMSRPTIDCRYIMSSSEERSKFVSNCAAHLTPREGPMTGDRALLTVFILIFMKNSLAALCRYFFRKSKKGLASGQLT